MFIFVVEFMDGFLFFRIGLEEDEEEGDLLMVVIISGFLLVG